ncbi:sigma-70 family RNA polymerase sigma factor [Enterococcus asini]|uniref:sigma-70 family RNA polymerase sigma factor n=1 Tax=Enterococcus asini TaxID=57732 RepID=UPI00288E671D|nr:sigma-70 family RNA polymerase sigma factor [Enterococcus asini]MDT2757868.1 sigma-70 family RNA polymerase sigma factor [Enterococcus asini]
MEDELITQLKKRDFAGLENLIAEYGEAILRTIHAILKESHEQSEWEMVENEVFYGIWEKINTYDSKKASFTTWVLMIARSKAIDKKRMLQRDLKNDELSDQSIRQIAYAVADPLAQEEFLELVDCLSKEDQHIFLLYYFYQESPADIADLLGINQGVIYNRLSRGRSKLKEVLSERSDLHGI